MRIVKRLLTLVTVLMICPALALAASDDVQTASTAHEQTPAPVATALPTHAPALPEEPAEGSADEESDARSDRETEDLDAPAGDADASDKPAVRAKKISVSLSSDVLFPGGSLTATSKIAPREALQAVEWSSSLSQVEVDASGLVRAKSGMSLPDEGLYVDIWARATDGSLVMNCATVRLMPTASQLLFFEEELTLEASRETQSQRVTMELAPAALYGLTRVEWTSSNPSVAQVYGSGMNGEVGVVSWADVTGSAVITARAADGSGVSDFMTVTVRDVP